MSWYSPGGWWKIKKSETTQLQHPLAQKSSESARSAERPEGFLAVLFGAGPPARSPHAPPERLSSWVNPGTVFWAVGQPLRSDNTSDLKNHRPSEHGPLIPHPHPHPGSVLKAPRASVLQAASHTSPGLGHWAHSAACDRHRFD